MRKAIGVCPENCPGNLDHVVDPNKTINHRTDADKEVIPQAHHNYICEVPVHIDGMMQVFVMMPEGCNHRRVFIGHSYEFKYREVEK